jgi:NAD(P)-dependent dehydrogenase (short-subunit alcohol dehydrogenase family)
MRLLEGKICLVTGAGTGIGAGSARVFAREGARLVLVGRTPATLEATRTQVQALGGEAIIIVADISKSADTERMVKETVEKFGRLDCAFNNAGIDGVMAPTADYPEDVWDKVMAINLRGVFNCLRAEIKAMQASGGGAILNVSSASTQPIMPMMPAYVASKYGLNGLTLNAAFEYARENIRINGMLVGVIATPMLEAFTQQHPEIGAGLIMEHAMRRLGTVEEIGDAAAWMLSDRNSFMTGANVHIDGGFSLPRRGH